MNRQSADLLTRPLTWKENDLKNLITWNLAEIVISSGLPPDEDWITSGHGGSPKEQDIRTGLIPAVPGLHFTLEELPSDMIETMSDQGVIFSRLEDLELDNILASLRFACDLIASLSPALHLSLRYLLRNLHVIENSGPGMDVSFSVPNLPHSIFVSIPCPFEKHAIPRLAEAIAHEVLHLQLSLVERMCPIIRTDREIATMYSPWRSEFRPEGGVVHGIFVFRGLYSMWAQVGRKHSESSQKYAHARMKEISEQISSFRPVDFQTLTPFGKRVIAELLGSKSQLKRSTMQIAS